MPIVMVGTGRRAEPLGTKTRLNGLGNTMNPTGGVLTTGEKRALGLFYLELSFGGWHESESDLMVFTAEVDLGNSLKTEGNRPMRTRM